MGCIQLMHEHWKRVCFVGASVMIILQIVLFTSLYEKIVLIQSSFPRTEHQIVNISELIYSSDLESLSGSLWPDVRNSSSRDNVSVCSEPSVAPSSSTTLLVNITQLEFSDLTHLYGDVDYGGHWFPKTCEAKHRAAIIVPFRHREIHLRIFLNNLHPFLQAQNLDYAIFVVEQKSGTIFNRGLLMNIGFAEASKLYDWQCYVFHDVDLLPEDARNFYTCPSQPRHLSAAVDKFQYKLLYANLFGGATILRTEHVHLTNGFSNQFWGWGGEDDDLYERTRYAGLKIQRYPLQVARYKMLTHNADKENPVNPKRFTLIRSGKQRYKADGISTLKYDLLKLEAKRLFTWIYVDVHKALEN